MPSWLFLAVRVLDRLFRRLLLQTLHQAHTAGQLHFFGDLEHLSAPEAFRRYLAPLGKKDWVVYTKPPFGGPRQVLEYLGRYTHRIAISNERLLSRTGPRLFPMERLSPSAAAQSNHVIRPGIHPSLSSAYAAAIPAHPLFRLSSQLPPRRQVGIMPLLANPVMDLLPRAADLRDFDRTFPAGIPPLCPRCVERWPSSRHGSHAMARFRCA